MRKLGKTHGALGMRHKAQYAAIVRSDARDIFERAVRIRRQVKILCRLSIRIFQRNRSVFFQLRENFRRRVILPLAVRNRYAKRLDAFEPWAIPHYFEIYPAAGVSRARNFSISLPKCCLTRLPYALPAPVSSPYENPPGTTSICAFFKVAGFAMTSLI